MQRRVYYCGPFVDLSLCFGALPFVISGDIPSLWMLLKRLVDLQQPVLVF